MIKTKRVYLAVKRAGAILLHPNGHGSDLLPRVASHRVSLSLPILDAEDELIFEIGQAVQRVHLWHRSFSFDGEIIMNLINLEDPIAGF